MVDHRGDDYYRCDLLDTLGLKNEQFDEDIKYVFLTKKIRKDDAGRVCKKPYGHENSDTSRKRFSGGRCGKAQVRGMRRGEKVVLAVDWIGCCRGSCVLSHTARRREA